MEGLQGAPDLRHVLEERQCFLNIHVEHFGDVLAPERYSERFPVEARSVALLAHHPNIGQEVHLDPALPVAHARLTAPALHIEAEAARRIPPALGLRHAREQAAYVVEDANIRGRVRARGAADRILRDVYNLVEMRQPLQPIVRSWPPLRIVQRAGECGIKGAGHEAALPRTAHAGHAGHQAERK